MSCNILIINPFGIGDVLFSTPLISVIKKRYPLGYIGYICNIRTKEILETNAAVNEIFVFERDEYRRLWRSSKIECIKRFSAFWQGVRKKRFDIVIDLSLGKEYAFFCWLVGIKERKGFNYKGRGGFLTHRIPFDGFNDKPVAEYYLDLIDCRHEEGEVSSVLLTTEKDNSYVDNFLKASNITQQDTLVGIVPGGGAAFGKDKAHYKRWPSQNFAELARRVGEKGARPILLWGPGEEDLVKDIQDRVNGKILVAPNTRIREMAVLMKRCKLVICNDGGMLHIAVSQDVPTISIFGPTDEKVYGPYPSSEKHIVVTSNTECRPCYKRFRLPECNTRKCLQDISIDAILNFTFLTM